MLAKSDAYKRELNLIAGEWVPADSGATLDVNNPATGKSIGTVPKSGKAETARAIEAAHKAFAAFRKTSALDRSKMLRRLADAITDNQEALARAADDGTGQVAGRGPRRSRHVRRLCAVVRRGGAPHLWRPRAFALGRPPHHGDEGAGRRRRRHHAVEFPLLDACAQDRAGNCSRLHRGGEAGLADALFGSCLGCSVRAGGHSRGRRQYRDRIGFARSAARSRRTRWCARSPSPAPPRSASS